VVIPQGEEARSLSGLPVAALGLTAQQAEAFELWGIGTAGELAALPEVDLIVRLGQPGKKLRMLARGEHPHLMVPEVLALTLAEFVELDAPLDLMEPLLFVLGPMIKQLATRAQSHALALASVTVSLGLDGGGEHRRTIKPALPLTDRELLLKLLHLDLQAHPPAAAVLSVRVTAEPGERGKVQLGLWSPQLPEPARLDVTLARIAALVGEDRVGSAVLRDTHRREGFAMKRFSVTGLPAAKEAQAGGAVALRHCRPAAVLAMRCEGRKPKAFHLSGTLYVVERAYGPWRRSGDWWSAEVWSVEEWDVEAVSPNQRLLGLISHDLLRRQWKLEAVYD
jgi:protein ImuB